MTKNKIKHGQLAYIDISHMTGVVIPSRSKLITKNIKKIEKLYSDEHPEEYEFAIQMFINKYKGIELDRVYTMDSGTIIKYDEEQRKEIK